MYNKTDTPAWKVAISLRAQTSFCTAVGTDYVELLGISQEESVHVLQEVGNQGGRNWAGC